MLLNKNIKIIEKTEYLFKNVIIIYLLSILHEKLKDIYTVDSNKKVKFCKFITQNHRFFMKFGMLGELLEKNRTILLIITLSKILF